MEPMDLDHEESFNRSDREHNSSVSDMEVDISPLRPVKKLTKTGYGIPEDDPTFSHFPERGQATSSSNLVHRRHSKHTQAEASAQDGHKDFNSSDRRTSSCLQACCSKISSLFKILGGCFIAYLAAAYFLSLQREKCRVSRRFDSEALKTDLETLVFGQHLVSEIIPREMDLYFDRLQRKAQDRDDGEVTPLEICKPLVLSFHGWTGVGKNFISKIISDSFRYTLVNHIVIPLHFPHEAFEHKYGQIIRDWLVSNSTSCLVNIVILDEMDKAFSPVTEGILAAVEALSQPCLLATPTIILMLSNSYATDINRLFFQFSSQLENREQMSALQFDSLFSKKLENSSWDSLLDRKDVIDAYVPFLPLERRHVAQCIKRELVSKRFSTDSDAVSQILEELTFTSVHGLEISVTGCKRVADKVDYVMLGL